MIRILSVYILFAVSLFVTAQENDTEQSPSQMHYVIDDLFVYMHAGPGREYRIVGSINAGTPVTVMQTDTEAEYTEVEDDRGRTGWLESRFVTEVPSVRQQIPQLRTQLSEQNDLLASRESDIARLQRDVASMQEVETLLRQQLDDVQAENTMLSARLQENDSAEKMDWFVKGGGVAFGGILLGLIISAVFKRRKRDQWM